MREKLQEEKEEESINVKREGENEEVGEGKGGVGNQNLGMVKNLKEEVEEDLVSRKVRMKKMKDKLQAEEKEEQFVNRTQELRKCRS